MVFMQLDQKDPTCPACMPNSSVELIAGNPCTIKVRVVLSAIFPAAGEHVTSATLKYSDDDGNTATKILGPPAGPAYSTYLPNATVTITFFAADWLTQGDFGGTTAELTVTTDRPREVVQQWKGVVP